MNYCHECRRHLNGAFACAGCGRRTQEAYRGDVDPGPPAVAPAQDPTGDRAAVLEASLWLAGLPARQEADSTPTVPAATAVRAVRRRASHRRRRRTALVFAAGLLLAAGGTLTAAELATDGSGTGRDSTAARLEDAGAQPPRKGASDAAAGKPTTAAGRPAPKLSEKPAGALGPEQAASPAVPADQAPVSSAPVTAPSTSGAVGTGAGTKNEPGKKEPLDSTAPSVASEEGFETAGPQARPRASLAPTVLAAPTGPADPGTEDPHPGVAVTASATGVAVTTPSAEPAPAPAPSPTCRPFLLWCL